MKRILLWVPIVGFFTTAYYGIIKGEEIVSAKRPYEYYISSFYQAASFIILIFYLMMMRGLISF